jgi:hypothetical protein
MKVMAFAMDEERLRIIEHNRRFYAEQYSTPTYELSMELVVQCNYLYNLMCESRASGDDRVAYEHVRTMHQQASASWQKLQVFDWNTSHGMSVEEATERMARNV